MNAELEEKTKKIYNKEYKIKKKKNMNAFEFNSEFSIHHSELIGKKMAQKKYISVKGSRVNNLKNVSIDLPRNRLIAITGISGAGKTSLAFDTVYAEGQRRFVESLSAYARQFMERMDKPDVDKISGIPPSIAIEQRPASNNPRSTVGTTTEIYDYIRLFFGRIGKTICHSCGRLIEKDNPTSVVDYMTKLENGTRIYILSQFNANKYETEGVLKAFLGKGYTRIFNINTKKLVEIEDIKNFAKIDLDEHLALIDRLAINSDDDTITRLTDSIENAFKLGHGKIVIYRLDADKFYKYSNEYECPDCKILFKEPEPKLFSFNNPFGACPHCQGFGRTVGIDEELVLPDKSKTLKLGAVAPFRTPGFIIWQKDMLEAAIESNISIDKPLIDFTEKELDFLWNGDGKIYDGINGYFQLLEEKSYKVSYRAMQSRYRGFTVCHKCGGSRLRTSARQVYIAGKNIPTLIKLSLNHLYEYFISLQLTEYEEHVVGQVLFELRRRIKLLLDIGLEYLSLERLTSALSGGELQRINLASALGSQLVGSLYILDEPSVGLHPSDTAKLMGVIKSLRALGNTVILVEHDPEIITQADFIVDIGPLAGEKGGEIIYSGDLEGLLKNKVSLTAKHINNTRAKKLNPEEKEFKNFIKVTKPKAFNLKFHEAKIPINGLTALTGVSGAGKSVFAKEILYKEIPKLIGFVGRTTASNSIITGFSAIDRVEYIDQSPISKSSRSTPITYTKVFDYIRELYASTQAAKQLGWNQGHFSFNVPGGRCEACEGDGYIDVEMQFLSDVKLICESCHGTRYKKEAQSILYNGKSIVDVLSMTIDEAADFFADTNKVVKRIKIMQDVGLGYLKLGQPSSMLSAGEAQRIKLATFLEFDKSDKKTLFIFDEPTTGLHLEDISRLTQCIKRLIHLGHTVVVIEHNLNFISECDWIIDLGPGAGEHGGDIVAQGHIKDIMDNKRSLTGKAMRDFYQL